MFDVVGQLGLFCHADKVEDSINVVVDDDDNETYADTIDQWIYNKTCKVAIVKKTVNCTYQEKGDEKYSGILEQIADAVQVSDRLSLHGFTLIQEWDRNVYYVIYNIMILKRNPDDYMFRIHCSRS